MLVTMLPSHDGDDAGGATWSWRGEDVESYWQLSYRVMLADDATGATWPRLDVDTESYWRQQCRVMLAITLPGRLGHDAM
jgi:hypothetical protein